MSHSVDLVPTLTLQMLLSAQFPRLTLLVGVETTTGLSPEPCSPPNVLKGLCLEGYLAHAQLLVNELELFLPFS